MDDRWKTLLHPSLQGKMLDDPLNFAAPARLRVDVSCVIHQGAREPVAQWTLDIESQAER